jgi:hypothetical protein
MPEESKKPAGRKALRRVFAAPVFGFLAQHSGLAKALIFVLPLIAVTAAAAAWSALAARIRD